ncbi:ATP-binding protein [Bacillus sp. FSL L8-0152]|uniref:ATP-binding protein n=1 Tax=Bacillus sp. FSL L8-0152 TaxID=2921516 RepID=UPI0030FC46CD
MIEFPIKYFEGDLVFSQDDSCWAYYELPGFNYDFTSGDEKETIFNRLKSFFWQIGLDTHLLIIPNHQSIREIHERFKIKLKGPLKDAATRHTDDVANQLESLLGYEGTEYRFYVGVKLQKPDGLKNSLWKDMKNAFKDFVQGVHEAVNLDMPTISEDLIDRYRKVERLAFNKVYGRLKGARISEDTIQFLIRRNWYRSIEKPPRLEWNPVYLKEEEEKTKVRRPVQYDTLRLTEGLVDESPKRSLILKQMLGKEEKKSHVAFLTMSNVPHEMLFPGNEWLYMIQTIDFPVEVSVRTETIENRKALSIVRNKQKELKDVESHARETGHEPSLHVLQARQESYELEAYLQGTRSPVLKVSIVLCVSAEDEDELKRRTDTIRDMYDDMGIKIEQPYGDQWLLFNEFLPGAKRYVKDYTHYMEPDTLAGSMYGATQQLGDGEGFFIATHGYLDQPVYMIPNRAAQGIKGSKTNALAMSFLGSLGGGKSFASNLITYLSVLGGAKALIIDPKSERGEWKEKLYEMKDQINIISLTSNKKNAGKLDPFIIHSDRKEAESLALNTLSFLTGVTVQDADRFPYLSRTITEVGSSEKPCMNKIIETLLQHEDPEARKLGVHIDSFKTLSFAHLLFSDGEVENAIQLETAMNILQIQDLELPEAHKPQEKYEPGEMLSVAMMISISSFALKFVKSDRSQYKVVLLDEAWAVLNTSQGRQLGMQMVRAGRSMNAGIYFVTQNANDLLDEKMKNNIGMKFAFRSTDPQEIKNVLQFFNLQETQHNIDTLKELENGQCLFQDIYGRVGVIRVNALFKDLFDAFDTRPPEEKETKTEDKEGVLT